MKPKNKSHAGDPRRSDLLRQTARALYFGRDGSATSYEIAAATGSLAVHSDIARLRELGFNISPAQTERRTEKGRRVVRYYLKSIPLKFKLAILRDK